MSYYMEIGVDEIITNGRLFFMLFWFDVLVSTYNYAVGVGNVAFMQEPP